MTTCKALLPTKSCMKSSMVNLVLMLFRPVEAVPIMQPSQSKDKCLTLLICPDKFLVIFLGCTANSRVVRLLLVGNTLHIQPEDGN